MTWVLDNVLGWWWLNPDEAVIRCRISGTLAEPNPYPRLYSGFGQSGSARAAASRKGCASSSCTVTSMP